MVGMEYWCEFGPSSETIADDLLWIGAPTDAVVFIEEIEITQVDVEVSQQARFQFFKTATDQSAVGSAITPRAAENHFPAAGSVVRDTTGGVDATISLPLWHAGFNVLNGLFIKGSYEEPLVILSPIAGAAGRFVIRNDATLTAALFTIKMKIREIGG